QTEEIVPIQIRRGRVQGGLFNRDDYFIDSQVNFRSGSQNRSGINLALWSWMSAFIDTLVLTSISCFGLILFSFLMKTPAREILRGISIEPRIMDMFIISFFFSFWVYMIMMRVFMGASLGEWSCQLRLGQPVQRIKPTYVLRVVARTTLLLGTGVVVFPILSLILNRDLLGDITGIRIYSLT
ncbi:MAG: RDD family protein, partial [Pseudobdellovibrio sp.]